MKKRVLAALLIFVLLCQWGAVLPVGAAGSSKGNAEAIVLDETVRPYLEKGTTHWYKILPDETQYYRFTFSNRSLEVRTGIGLADDLLNLFVGKMTVTIYDQYDTKLAVQDIRCGYEASISRLLQEGSTYYVTVTSSVSGNYFMTTKKLQDIGGNSWQQATEILPTGQFASAIDVAGEKDWFCFRADEERAYYNFSLENLNGGKKYFSLYEYVEGAGETPLRTITEFSVDNGTTNSRNLQLNSGSLYYYVISSTSTGTGGYVVNTTETLDAASNQQSEAYEIETEKTYISAFDGAGDADWFSFKTAEVDAYYHLNFKRLSGNSYLYMQFYDADGNALAGARLYKAAEESYTFNIKLAPNTTYYVYLCTESNAGNYTFSVDAKADPHPDQQKDAVEIELNREYSSSFDGTGDADWVKFQSLDASGYYHLTFNRASGNSYVFVQLYDENGVALAGYRLYVSAGTSYTCNAQLAPNTTYYALLRTESQEGYYTFSVTAKPDEDADKKEEATEITLGTKNERELQADADVDWFVVEILTGGEYQVDMLNESCANLECRLYTARDREMLYVSGTREKTVTLEAGTHYLKIYGKRGYYTFTVRSLLPGDTNGDGVINGLDNKGDVDGDGQITSTDARLTLQYYAGKIKAADLNTAVADVDGDGSITSTDARLILQKYAGKIEDFPVNS